MGGGRIGSPEQDLLSLILEHVRELEVEVYKRTGMRFAIVAEAEPELYDRLLAAVAERRSTFYDRAQPHTIEERADLYAKGTDGSRIRVGRDRRFIVSDSITIRRMERDR